MKLKQRAKVACKLQSVAVKREVSDDKSGAQDDQTAFILTHLPGADTTVTANPDGVEVLHDSALCGSDSKAHWTAMSLIML